MRPEYAITVDVVRERGRWLVQVVDGRATVLAERAYYRKSTARRQRGNVRHAWEQAQRQLTLPGIDR